MTGGPADSEPFATIGVSGRVFATEFSSCCAPTLLALGMRQSIVILQLTFPEDVGEEDNEQSGLAVKKIRELNHDCRVQCLAWPVPAARFLSNGRFSLASGGADGCVRLFTLVAAAVGSGSGGDCVETLYRHSDYVNSVAFQPSRDDDDDDPLIASGSDDCSLVLLSNRGKKRHVITFGSPVMTVMWHPAEEAKLMAAEKSGTIHILNSTTFHPIQSVASSTLGPLSCADWSLQNSLLVLSCLRSEVLVWDLSCPSTPALAKTMHDEGVTTAKFSSTHESIIATAGQPNYSVKIIDAKASNVLYSSSEKPVGGISWHKRLGYVAIGRDLCVTIHSIPG